MYNLVIEPANQPVDFNGAVKELYEHAHRRHLSVVHEGIFDGQHRYQLLSMGCDRHLVQRAYIEAVR